ncbi:MAG: C40 family peptidase [Clostridia bacterium]|nr:C40 family peptidase [Clostridia bacterium]
MAKLFKILLAAVVLTALLTLSAFAFDIKGGTVKTASAVNFRSAPDTSSDVLEKIYDTERVAVLGESGSFYKAAYNGRTGYIHKDYVELQPIMNIKPGNAKITASALNVRSAPGTQNSIVTKLYEGNVCEIIGINSGWLKVTYGSDTGYIHPDYIEVVSASVTAKGSSSGGAKSSGGGAAATGGSASSGSIRRSIIEYAAKFLGVPYSYGGSSPSGFDCSGFTKYVFDNFGITLARSSADQYSSSVTKISRSDLNLGDLVFFSRNKAGVVGHVGIYVGNGDFIHAPSPGNSVCYDSLDSTYYSTHYIGCGTVF